MKNIIIILTIIVMGTGYSQTYQDTICWVWVNDVQFNAAPGEDFSSKAALNAILEANHVVYYEKALPFSKTPELHKIHEIRCNRYGHIDNVINDLNSSFSGTFDRFSKFEVMDSVYVYDPIDWMWVAHADDWLWHLKRIQADYAWDITKGDPEIKIAVIDYDFDVTHPDLASEITPNYDPYSNYQFTCEPFHWHGTTVASFASAETTEQGGTPLGQLASIGFNTKIIGYISGSRQTNLAKALHACNVMGADVMVSCAGGSLNCSPDPNSGEELIIKEILDNGMSIVMPAGNGPNGPSCGPAGNQHAFYPFNPEYDDRIIIVTSTDFDDNHYYENSQGENKTHSHFPEVDICSPGYEIMGVATTECGGNTWPYFGGYGGTSFSSPIVAGVVSLLKSINEDFTPGEIQELIKRTADPVTDGQNYQGLIGTGRINAFAAVDLAANCSPEIITGIETWTDDRIILCGLIVENGAQLTIQSLVRVSHHCKVVVKPGGKLILDSGSIMTSLDNIPWRGIEVRGHINQPQHPSYQGVVEIKNGGTIKNALFGIRTIHAEDDENAEGELLDPTSSGGIVFANNARFVNNKTAVRFYSYPSNSLSSFIDCRFETDADLINGVIPDYFIWIDHISGIDIKNCSFNNTTGIDYLHSGIYARDATFRIEGNCISQVQPCTEWQYGWFRKLNYAVYVVNTSTNYYPDIRHTDFSLCKRSIYISTTDGARVTSCRFYMPEVLPFTMGDYGLYLNNSFGYHIEDNQFMGPSPSLLGGIGLYINFSGEHWNQVYNNSFSNLNYGTMAYGLNRKPDGVGLCIKCNDYDYNKYDIVVNGKQNIGHGIAYNQGYMGTNDTLPAGNTFTQNFSPLVYNYMNSKGMEWVNYVYHGMNPTQERVNPEPYYSPLTMSKQANTNATYSKTFACPSKLDAGGGSHERDGIEAAEAQINQKQAQLVALVDGGNTFDMNLNVITSTPPEASEVYNNLMGESPFLSDTVMKSAIYKENVLPSAMVRDVLVANPQSAKNNEILKAIDERFDPMPEWMKEQVLQGINITGAKEALESELANWQSKRAEHFNNLYQYFRKDTINPLASTDSLELLLILDNQIESKYRLAFLKIEQGIWNEGFAVLNAIPASFGLSAGQQAVHQDYLSLFSVLMQLNGNLPVEGSAEALQLEQLAADDENFPGACARNLLIGAGLIEYEEPIVLPEEGLKSSEAIGNRTDKNTGKPEVLKVFPTPAGDYFIAEYNAEGYTGDVFLLVTDVTGKTVYTRQFSNNRDQVVINTEDWSSGIYLVSLLVNGKIIKCENVIIK